MPDRKAPENTNPGNGLWGWFGRQVGHVKTAIKHDPVKGAKATPETPPTEAQTAKPQAAKPSEVLYRADQVEELPHPTNPQLKLRRTVIDEVIVDPKKES